MDNSFGITVTSPNNSASDPTTNASQKLINTKYPFHKLDVTNPVSFANVLITFSKDVPSPVGDAATNQNYDTVVYTLPHGYTYVPVVWTLYQASGLATGYNYRSATFLSNNITSNATILVYVDATNIYFIVRKTFVAGFGGSPVDVTGVVLKFRVYVFAESLIE